MRRFRGWAAGLCCTALLLLATPGLADTVKIVVPFAAGGPVDQLARILAAELGGQLADPLKTTVVQNQRCMTTWVVTKNV